MFVIVNIHNYVYMQILKGSHKAGRIDHVRVGGQNGADIERVEMLMKVYTCTPQYTSQRENYIIRFSLSLKLN
jgi:Ni,Fe-hydrogenase III small subunit